MVLAIAAGILFLGTRSAEKSTPLLLYVAAGLSIVSLLGVFGLLPSISTGAPEQWFLGISPEGFGTVGMIISFGVAIVTTLATTAPPQDVQDMVEEIRIPSIRAHPVHDPSREN